MNENLLFKLPVKDFSNIQTLIEQEVQGNKSMNIGLFSEKYVNRYVFERQSNVKRQLFLLSKERIESLARLNRSARSLTKLNVENALNRPIRSLRDAITNLKFLDVDGAITDLYNTLRDLRRLQDHNLKNMVNPVRKDIDSVFQQISNINLCIPKNLLPLDLYSKLYGRFESIFRTLRERQGYFIPTPFKAKLSWRLAINLGAASIYETSISFHRNYSVPIIPGSAVKGVTRAWAFSEKIREDIPKIEIEKIKKKIDITEEDALYTAERSRDINDTINKLLIFGTQKQEGKVIFFDGLPIIDTDSDFIVLDIMNAHYGDYYQDKDGTVIPGDWMDPVPVFFLVVEKIHYQFTLASMKEYLVKRALELLKEAIRKIGIGAKTASGYGYFE